ncbi:hypothetical protein AVEN_225746-1 [Araneus ventricosus]|uniref:Uncharacterized protein n=1 Tax=Araneus ventricosus TaxID=182803 RepID=A0A4Y2FX71_ARAVE|nr:hypothetical protein AVEN_225746-1 [Araneus ventricosus]
MAHGSRCDSASDAIHAAIRCDSRARRTFTAIRCGAAIGPGYGDQMQFHGVRCSSIVIRYDSHVIRFDSRISNARFHTTQSDESSSAVVVVKQKECHLLELDGSRFQMW